MKPWLLILSLWGVDLQVRALRAATINAASPSRADVGSAYASASDGDTIAIPAGTATWTSGLTITKAITLQGAGIGQTIIRNNVDGYGNYLMDWTLVANLTSRMTGIEFNDNGSDNTAPAFRFSGTNIDNRRLRIDNCKFDQLLSSIAIWYTCLGVFDHNVVVARSSGVPGFIGQIVNSSWGYAADTGAWGDGAWVEADNFGTDKFFFFEDNTFTNLYSTGLTALDGHSGARYVFRYNTMDRGSLEVHGAEATRTRAGRAQEVYMNTFTGNDTRSSIGYWRGGVGVVFSNTISGWTTSATFSLLDNRSVVSGFAPISGADGRNNWDINHASNPFVTGTCSSAGTLTMTDSGKSWTVNQWAGYTVRRTSGKTVSSLTRSGYTATVSCTSHGFSTGDQVSIIGANQYGYNGQFSVTVTDANTFTFTTADNTITTPATGTLKAIAKSWYAQIISNTSTQLTFAGTGFGSTWDCTFTNGDTYEINKVTQAMDQIGISGGADLAGVNYPTLPGAWNNQTVSAWYEWANTREGGADVDFSNTFGGGGTYAVIVSGTHFIGDTVKPGYTPYTYPHPLVSGGGGGGGAGATRIAGRRRGTP